MWVLCLFYSDKPLGTEVMQSLESRVFLGFLLSYGQEALNLFLLFGSKYE